MATKGTDPIELDTLSVRRWIITVQIVKRLIHDVMFAVGKCSYMPREKVRFLSTDSGPPSHGGDDKVRSYRSKSNMSGSTVEWDFWCISKRQ